MADATADAATLRFAPFASCPDAAFFTELARRKLHEFKLDDHPVPIRATYARAPRADAVPSLFLGADAFEHADAGGVPPALCAAAGTLRNANTIDDFKEWDKAKLLEAAAAAIWAEMSSGTAWTNPSALTRFLALSFADLKTHRFYYWFAFPAFALAPPPRTAAARPLHQTIDQAQLAALRDGFDNLARRAGQGGGQGGGVGAPAFFAVRLGGGGAVEVEPLARWREWRRELGAGGEPTGEPNGLWLALCDPSGGGSGSGGGGGVAGWPMRNLLALAALTLAAEGACGEQRLRVLSLRDDLRAEGSGPRGAAAAASVVFDVLLEEELLTKMRSSAATGGAEAPRGGGEPPKASADEPSADEPSAMSGETPNGAPEGSSGTAAEPAAPAAETAAAPSFGAAAEAAAAAAVGREEKSAGAQAMAAAGGAAGGAAAAVVAPAAVGWEKNSAGRAGPRLMDLASRLEPTKLASEAVELNLRLMRWRLMPALEPATVAATKCLLLGAGTLGCAVARALLGWGVKHITFVDAGVVAYSNPVRQALFEFRDCVGGQTLKAPAAAAALRRIHPSVTSEGHVLSIPMPGHGVSPAEAVATRAAVATLHSLVESHDAVFLLTDTRESRWLPSLVAHSLGRTVITAALGFDSLLVMRHGASAKVHAAAHGDSHLGAPPRLGCYFCNDVVAPSNSMLRRTLDQQCTVSRPGLSMLASAMAVELLVSLLHHPHGQAAAADASANDTKQQQQRQEVAAATAASSAAAAGGGAAEQTSPLGTVPHQIRTSLPFWRNDCMTAHAFERCTACGPAVIDSYQQQGFDFLLQAFNKASYLEELTGLAEMHRAAEAALEHIDAFDDDFE